MLVALGKPRERLLARLAFSDSKRGLQLGVWGAEQLLQEIPGFVLHFPPFDVQLL
jgi:hypothetical protein